MSRYECEKCGTVWPEKLVTEWGRTAETDGMGNQPKCIQLVPNDAAPKARNSSNDVVEDDLPMEVCGGMLQRTDAEAHKGLRFTEIKPGRRL